MGLILLYLKFDNPDSAFTHTLNNLRYYINCGIVVLICSSLLFMKPKLRIILLAFLITLPTNLILQSLLPEMNYFVRAFWVIFSGLTFAFFFNFKRRIKLSSIAKASTVKNYYLGVILFISLILLHFLFH
jgi:SSS family solute:Na+ symporter